MEEERLKVVVEVIPSMPLGGVNDGIGCGFVAAEPRAERVCASAIRFSANGSEQRYCEGEGGSSSSVDNIGSGRQKDDFRVIFSQL